MGMRKRERSSGLTMDGKDWDLLLTWYEKRKEDYRFVPTLDQARVRERKGGTSAAKKGDQ